MRFAVLFALLLAALVLGLEFRRQLLTRPSDALTPVAANAVLSAAPAAGQRIATGRPAIAAEALRDMIDRPPFNRSRRPPPQKTTRIHRGATETSARFGSGGGASALSIGGDAAVK